MIRGWLEFTGDVEIHSRLPRRGVSEDERDKAVKYVDRLIDRLVSQSLAGADGGREAEC